MGIPSQKAKLLPIFPFFGGFVFQPLGRVLFDSRRCWFEFPGQRFWDCLLYLWQCHYNTATSMAYLPQTIVLCDLRHHAFEVFRPAAPSDSGLVSKWRPKDRVSFFEHRVFSPLVADDVKLLFCKNACF